MRRLVNTGLIVFCFVMLVSLCREFRPYTTALKKLVSLKTLRVEQAKALAFWSSSYRARVGITTITPEVAKALAKHEGELWFDGLTTITPEVAEALAKHKGGLALDGLTTLTPEIAAALAKHNDHLRLNGLTTITQEVAEALAKHEYYLELLGLATLSRDALATLQANPKINLSPTKIARSLPNKSVQPASVSIEATQATVTEVESSRAAIEETSATTETSPSFPADSMAWFMGVVVGLVAIIVLISLAMR